MSISLKYIIKDSIESNISEGNGLVMNVVNPYMNQWWQKCMMHTASPGPNK